MEKTTDLINAYLGIIVEASSRMLPDDADFLKEMNNAVASNLMVRFNYTKKDGSKHMMTVLPFKVFEVRGKKVVKAYLNGVKDAANERMLYIDSMGSGGSVSHAETSGMTGTSDNPVPVSSTNSISLGDEMPEDMRALSPGLSSLLEIYPALGEAPNPYYFTMVKCVERKELFQKLRTDYAFFKLVGYSPETNKVVIECHENRAERSSYKDGDYDDGMRHSWTTNKAFYTPREDWITAYMWGDFRDGKVYAYNGVELEKMISKGITRSWISNDKWGSARRI